MDISGLWMRAITMVVEGSAMHQDVDGQRKKRLQEGLSKKLMDDYARGSHEQSKDLAKKLAKKKRLASPDLDM